MSLDDIRWATELVSELVEAVGEDVVLRAPLLLPIAEHFPDVIEEGAVGARQLIRRMMRHASLGHLRVDVDYASSEEHTPETGAPIEFIGCSDEKDVAFFSIHALESVDVATEFLCFEVGLAYGAHHGLVAGLSNQEALDLDYADPDLALLEKRAAVYAYCLGLGVIALNGVEHFQKSGHLEGTMAHTYWRTTRAGALDSQQSATLLALWTVLRDSPKRELKSIAAHLRPNQRAVFRKARQRLTQIPRRDVLASAGFSLESSWRSPRSVDTEVLEVEEQDADLAEAELDALDALDARRLVYRISERRGSPVVITTVCVPAVLALAIVGPGVGTALGLCAAAGATYYFTRKHSYCSDGDCGRSLSADDEVCSGCQAQVAGDVGSRLEALDLPIRQELPSQSPYRSPGHE
ncbi:MAG: hypothetical protein AB8H86_26855 [Polyangiales bacterium]